MAAQLADLGAGPGIVQSDGRLVSGSKDKTIKVWNVSACAEQISLHIGTIPYCLAALPDGRVVAGDEKGALHWLRLT